MWDAVVYRCGVGVGEGGRAELRVLELSRASGPHWGLVKRQLSSARPRPIADAEAVRSCLLLHDTGSYLFNKCQALMLCKISWGQETKERGWWFYHYIKCLLRKLTYEEHLGRWQDDMEILCHIQQMLKGCIEQGRVDGGCWGVTCPR